MQDLPRVVVQVAERALRQGGRALLVGGSVRDWLLGRAIKDWDVEVYGIPEDHLPRLLRGLGRVNAVGKAFGVWKLHTGTLEVDVSLPRRDSKQGPGHRGIAVQGDPTMSPAEASRRRDLTVNAIMVDPLTSETLDPWGGVQDLHARILRPVDPQTFLEDPLRALRVVQFAARLDMRPTPALLDLCRQAALDELPAERIEGEWRKLLMQAARPSVGLGIARHTGVLARVFPEAAGSDTPLVDVALDRLGPLALDPPPRRYAVLLAAWLHAAPGSSVEATLDRLWLHTWDRYPLREQVVASLAHWQDAIDSDAALRHLSTHAEAQATLTLRWALTGSPEALQALERAQQLGVAHAPPAPLLQGRDLLELGLTPGPRIGKLLELLYRRQLDGTDTTTEQAREAARSLLSDPEGRR